MPISRSSLGLATTAARCAHLDQAAGRELPDRLAQRRARHPEAPRQHHLVERRAGRKRAAHDLVGKLKPQLLRERAAAIAKGDAHDRDPKC